jgi:cysteine desulfurase / selenocysteine lyase
MPYDVQALRRAEFPWADAGDVAYLNNASIGPLPRRAVEAVNAFTALRAQPHRISPELQFGTLAESRERIARLIGADVGEIALSINTGHGLNLAAHALPLAAGDVVLGAVGEFPANVYPWMALEPRGVAFRMVEPTLEAVLEALEEDESIRAVAVSWVGFASGYRMDLESLSRACRARGAYLVVDAIQGFGALELDLRRCEVDILACGAQKWLLSPWGTGFTYIRRQLVTRLEPQVISWLGVRDSDDFNRLVEYDMTWRDDARRFEQLTLPFQEFAGLNAALALFEELGVGAVARHVAALADRIVAWAQDAGAPLVTPVDPLRRAGIVSVRVPDGQAASTALAAAGVVHSLREGAIRLSPHLFNTTGEVDVALRALESQLSTTTSA